MYTESIEASKNASATRLVASSIGVVAGLAGMEHGFFEILQGDLVPSGRVVDAIGPAQRFWEYGVEPAFTLIPNFFVTGIMAMLTSLFVLIWAAAYIDRKHGAWVLMLLSIMMFLVGGGFAPPVCAILAIVAATAIDKPLVWWRRHLPVRLRDFLARLWEWSLIAFVLLVLFAMELAIFGYPLLWFFSADNTVNLLSNLGNITFFGLGPVVIVAAFAYDIQIHSGMLRARPNP
ncbi:MAG: hypothetical protein P8X95_20585 [Anaerolineales bacterium]|jgi:hypothetical protein